MARTDQVEERALVGERDDARAGGEVRPMGVGLDLDQAERL
jgi:hypothetical protein